MLPQGRNNIPAHRAGRCFQPQHGYADVVDGNSGEMMMWSINMVVVMIRMPSCDDAFDDMWQPQRYACGDDGVWWYEER
jgi:hypothetical protein